MKESDSNEARDRIHQMPAKKRIMLIAHDGRKADLLEWAKFNVETLTRHRLFATGSTGALLRRHLGLEVEALFSGPLGGDQQAGARIAQGDVDILVFFWDPLEPQPHDVDVKALLRISVVYNIPTACNRATADFLISSELFRKAYPRTVIDYSRRMARPKWVQEGIESPQDEGAASES